MEPVANPGSASRQISRLEYPAITGVGLVTPLGKTVDQNWGALLAGHYISNHSRLDEFVGPNRVTDLARLAAAQALTSANWTCEICNAPETALVLATSKGPIETWLAGSIAPSGIADVAAHLAGSLGLGEGPRLTLSAACASGLHALARASLALLSGEASRALVVAVEASVHPLFISSFRRLGVLAPKDFGCRPFDLNRQGFVMSEAAAAVCLEISDAENVVKIEKLRIAGDATHLTGSDPDGKALRKILQQVAGGREVDLVHAHSTATVTNDPIELAAIKQIAGKNSPVLYSHKGALGHSLGAAGLISVVLNCLCHTSSAVPPNVQSTHPMQMQGLAFSELTIKRPIRRSIALAAGFGGALGAVSLVSR